MNKNLTARKLILIESSKMCLTATIQACTQGWHRPISKIHRMAQMEFGVSMIIIFLFAYFCSVSPQKTSVSRIGGGARWTYFVRDQYTWSDGGAGGVHLSWWVGF